jgi:hypothetical protein
MVAMGLLLLCIPFALIAHRARRIEAALSSA